MLWSEWSYIWHTRGMRQILLGILLIPSFYAVIFLASLWNPYGNLRRLPVAVVDQDVAVVRHHHRTQLGADLTQRLRTSHAAHFAIMSAGRAQHQLNRGQVYLVITIPKDFSTRARQLGDPHFRPIDLRYQTNAGFSFIAMKLSTTLVQHLQTTLNQQMAATVVTSLSTGLHQTGTGLQHAGTTTTQVTTGLHRVTAGQQTTDQGLQRLQLGAGQLGQGLSQVTTQTTGATDVLVMLASNTRRLQRLLTQPITSATQRTMDKLFAVNASLTQRLTQGNQRLNDALTQLTTGSQRLTHGLQQATTADAALATATQTLSGGTAQLTKRLTTQGAALATTGQRTTAHRSQLVTPIRLIHHDATTVANNGTGMAPYLMAVALFVGCITFNIIYDMFTPHRRPRNAGAWWLAKMPFFLTFTWAADTLMLGLLCVVDHLSPLQFWPTYAFSLLTVWTFGSIVTFFNLILGKTGAWLMLLFMILQLGGSAGTYPSVLSNDFFRAIHPYLPMSIAIDALRSTLSIGNSIRGEVGIFLLLFALFNGLIFLTFHLKRGQLDQLRF